MSWLKATLDRSGGSWTPASGTDPGEAEGETAQAAATDPGEAASETAQTTATQGAPATQGGLGDLMRRLRTSPSRMAASVLAAFIVLCVFTVPFIILVITVEFAGESESESAGYTYLEATRELDDAVGDRVSAVLFVVLAAVAIAAMASVVLPRWVVILVGLAGMGMTFLGFIWLFVRFLSLSEQAGGVSASALTLPHLGSFLVGGCFFIIVVLQLIPGLSRARA